jgi:hypothetical protein
MTATPLQVSAWLTAIACYRTSARRVPAEARHPPRGEYLEGHDRLIRAACRRPSRHRRPLQRHARPSRRHPRPWHCFGRLTEYKAVGRHHQRIVSASWHRQDDAASAGAQAHTIRTAGGGGQHVRDPQMGGGQRPHGQQPRHIAGGRQGCMGRGALGLTAGGDSLLGDTPRERVHRDAGRGAKPDRGRGDVVITRGRSGTGCCTRCCTPTPNWPTTCAFASV